MQEELSIFRLSLAFKAHLLLHRENQVAFSRYKILPRMLVDVSSIDTFCSLLGKLLGSTLHLMLSI